MSKHNLNVALEIMNEIEKETLNKNEVKSLKKAKKSISKQLEPQSKFEQEHVFALVDIDLSKSDDSSVYFVPMFKDLKYKTVFEWIKQHFCSQDENNSQILKMLNILIKNVSPKKEFTYGELLDEIENLYHFDDKEYGYLKPLNGNKTSMFIEQSFSGQPSKDVNLQKQISAYLFFETQTSGFSDIAINKVYQSLICDELDTYTEDYINCFGEAKNFLFALLLLEEFRNIAKISSKKLTLQELELIEYLMEQIDLKDESDNYNTYSIPVGIYYQNNNELKSIKVFHEELDKVLKDAAVKAKAIEDAEIVED